MRVAVEEKLLTSNSKRTYAQVSRRGAEAIVLQAAGNDRRKQALPVSVPRTEVTSVCPSPVRICCSQTMLPGAPLVDAAAAEREPPSYYRPDKLVRTGGGGLVLSPAPASAATSNGLVAEWAPVNVLLLSSPCCRCQSANSACVPGCWSTAGSAATAAAATGAAARQQSSGLARGSSAARGSSRGSNSSLNRGGHGCRGDPPPAAATTTAAAAAAGAKPYCSCSCVSSGWRCPGRQAAYRRSITRGRRRRIRLHANVNGNCWGSGRPTACQQPAIDAVRGSSSAAAPSGGLRQQAVQRAGATGGGGGTPACGWVSM